MEIRGEVTASEGEFRFDAAGGVGDNLNVLHREGGPFDFEIDEPWAGDTETGFGQRCDISLDAAAAKALADWIYARLALPIIDVEVR